MDGIPATAGMEHIAGLSPVAFGSLLLLVITLIILYLKPKSSIQPGLKPPKTAVSLEAPTTPGKPTVRILYGTQVGNSAMGQHRAVQRTEIIQIRFNVVRMHASGHSGTTALHLLLNLGSNVVMGLVCWCLQTGTAERFSKQLGNELRRKYGDGVVVEVVDIENYKAETRLPKEKLVLYLMATYGETAVPCSMQAVCCS